MIEGEGGKEREVIERRDSRDERKAAWRRKMDGKKMERGTK